MTGLTTGHAEKMDAIYRWQRPIYDLTRKYYLFGRDGLIEGLDAGQGRGVLEIGCGTGRNLALIHRRWAGARLYGLDISHEMLRSAGAKLQGKAELAQGDACTFDPQVPFGRNRFDAIIFSYALSMIPDWQAAMDHACSMLAPGGAVHMVDFGLGEGMPAFARHLLLAWLRRFHVTPRRDMAQVAQALARKHGASCHVRAGALGYFQQIVIRAPG